MSSKGITVRTCVSSVKETMDKLTILLGKKGAIVYARIDQQAEAQRTGQELPPLEFLLFGSPKAGVPIMAENALAALDLPLKIICWEDKKGQVWVAYNKASYIRERFCLEPVVADPLDLDGLVDKFFMTLLLQEK